MKRHGKCLNAILMVALAGAVFLSFSDSAQALFITLTNATATFSQAFGGGFLISNAIDGITTTGNGWAVANVPESGPITVNAQTAAFETVSDVSNDGGTFTFKLVMNYANAPFSDLLGHFRLSVTTDNRSTFADGNQGTLTPGDVSANWTQLTPLSASSLNGTAFTFPGDNSILATYTPYPTYQYTDTFTVTAYTSLADITGIRLEAMEDPSLPPLAIFTGPNGGPGFDNLNGNFVLTEFQVDFQAIPEPSILLLFGAGGVVLWRLRKRE